MRDALELLEWPTVQQHLQDLCWTPYGIECWQEKPFLDSVDAVKQHLVEVDSLKVLIERFGDPILAPTIPDLRPALRRVAKGALLSLPELREILIALRECRALIRHFAKNLQKDDEGSLLTLRLEGMILPTAVIELLEQYLSPEGELLDTASPRLGPLRKRILAERRAIQEKLQRTLQNPDYAMVLQATVITERDGRSVLPVKVEHKSTIPGIIHAGSGSGATLFVEPHAVVELNNRLQGTEAELQQEIQRILQEISAHLEGEAPELLLFIEQVAEVDKLSAAARFSRLVKGTPPVVVEGESLIDLKQARHPLLVLQQGGSVIGNDLPLGIKDVKTLVMTGPNTGGKTVLLKTIGLCGVMLHAGLHLPVAEGSRMSLLDPILADIGDQQSISQNLSTFSAHLESLKGFVADETDLHRGLVLIDELAAGTDPAEGSALAKAVLDELYEKGALTIITTHLSDLKLEAHHHPGYLNASVEFNPETLSPTYRLILGSPGTSHAITIAQRLGLKETVIEKARQATSQPTRDSAALIEDLEQKNRKLTEELQRAEAYRLSTQESYQAMELKRQQFEEEGKRILQQYKASLKSRMFGLEEQVKRLKKKVDAPQPKPTMPSEVSEKLKRLDNISQRVFEETQAPLAAFDTPTPELSEFKMGETVWSKKLGLEGSIVSISKENQELTLQAGNLRVNVPLSDVEKKRSTFGVARPKAKKAPGIVSRKVPKIPVPDLQTSECDVRGLRADEALKIVQKFLDDASLLGFEKVGIIHGMGTGALKKAIQDYLQGEGATYVKNFYPAEARDGGVGKTIIEL